MDRHSPCRESASSYSPWSLSTLAKMLRERATAARSPNSRHTARLSSNRVRAWARSPRSRAYTARALSETAIPRWSPSSRAISKLSSINAGADTKSLCSLAKTLAAKRALARIWVRGAAPGSFRTLAKKSRPSDRKSTRLNSSHGSISYAVFCLKKKKKHNYDRRNTDKKLSDPFGEIKHNILTTGDLIQNAQYKITILK